MTPKERIAAVINLETPDRVPLAPLLDHFAATHAGYTKAEIMNDPDKRIAAVLKTMRDLGPWDMTFAADTANTTLLKMGVPIAMRLPGRELPDDEIHQFLETEFLTPDDYALLVKTGFIRFVLTVVGRNHPELKGIQGVCKIIAESLVLRKHRKQINAAGAEMACGFIITGPSFEYFSFGRGMTASCMDLYDRPEKIKAVRMVYARAFTTLAITVARIVGVPRVFIGLARSSPSLISPALFEEFVFPELSYMVIRLVKAGVTPILHCDTDWSLAFETFRRLPARKCILELDGTSDMVQAKKNIGDHMCLMGDVPAQLLAFGSREEVLIYCRRLIETVGKGGGFILSSGCSIPANARPENVKALTEAVEKWGRY